MFKVGDKVRVIAYPNQRRVGLICKICEVKPTISMFDYTIKRGAWIVAVHRREIEKVITKGEQLMLFEI